MFTLRVSDSLSAFIVEPGQAAGSAPVTLRLNSSLDYEDPNQRKFILEVRYPPQPFFVFRYLNIFVCVT